MESEVGKGEKKKEKEEEEGTRWHTVLYIVGGSAVARSFGVRSVDSGRAREDPILCHAHARGRGE